ncbi:MAG: hypothetical protein A3H27_15860 [Acidobacteria bacterium RIFCSPLOWO2_02_FULL_59_13]|nr:MAG: hypothetical protein A3H27_15860 [Acidobacteria bacterium RIFCSPLOWO2_02_FULL_59_13]
MAHQRWATGVLAFWYPLMEPPAVRKFERDVIATGIRKILKLELSVLPESRSGSLRGCGMLVVNPPWEFGEEAAPMLAWLWQILSPRGEGGHGVSWLAPE